MLETERLRLRQWKDEDYPAYARLNADPMVMRYFPSTLSEQQSHEQADKLRSLITERGWGGWAVELKASGEFIGISGLHTQAGDSGIPHAPLTEIVWLLTGERVMRLKQQGGSCSLPLKSWRWTRCTPLQQKSIRHHSG